MKTALKAILIINLLLLPALTNADGQTYYVKAQGTAKALEARGVS